MGRLSESAATLRPYAMDTGAFRVGNKGATELASACTAALNVAAAQAAVAELIEAAIEMNRLAKGPAGGVSQADKRAIVNRMESALANVTGGAA